jgi:hypothetical protein
MPRKQNNRKNTSRKNTSRKNTSRKNTSRKNTSRKITKGMKRKNNKIKRGGMQRSVSRARSPSPAPPTEWRGSEFPWTLERRSIEAAPDFSGPYRKPQTEEERNELELYKANRALQKAQEHLRKANQGKEVERMLKDVNSIIDTISGLASGYMVEPVSYLGKKGTDIMGKIGETAYKGAYGYGIGPGIKKYYQRELRNTAPGTPERDVVEKRLETLKKTGVLG